MNMSIRCNRRGCYDGSMQEYRDKTLILDGFKVTTSCVSYVTAPVGYQWLHDLILITDCWANDKESLADIKPLISLFMCLLSAD